MLKNNLLQFRPQVAQFWHPTLNHPLKPSDISYGSKKVAWWICKKGHEYDAPVCDRAKAKIDSCPYCSGHRVLKENSLQIIYPEIAAECHPTKNGKLTPLNIAKKSGKKVWWKCSKGHEWQAKVNHRTEGQGCPYCAGQKADIHNSLGNKHPNLLKEWHTEKNRNSNPFKVTPSSKFRAWWKCKKGHEWRARIDSRKKGRVGCPYCSGLLATPKTCLRTVNPDLASEWHTTKNRGLTTEKVLPYSDKYAWWKCCKGHVWLARISNRSAGTGCPECKRLLRFAPLNLKPFNL